MASRMCIAVVLAMALFVTGASAQLDCTMALNSLTPCLTYVTGPTPTPGQVCCDGIRNVNSVSPACLCQVITGLNSNPSVNQTKAYGLPRDCNVQVNTASCPAFSAPPLPSSMPPLPSSMPPGMSMPPVILQPPTMAPVSTPMMAPVSTPMMAPVSTPMMAPVSTPMMAPVSTPMMAPVSTPMMAPASTPTMTTPPTSTPIIAPPTVPATGPGGAPVGGAPGGGAPSSTPASSGGSVVSSSMAFALALTGAVAALAL